jgi:hypothetical protein
MSASLFSRVSNSLWRKRRRLWRARSQPMSDGKTPRGRRTWNSGFAEAARVDSAGRTWYGAMRIPFSDSQSASPRVGTQFRINLYRSQGPPPKPDAGGVATDKKSYFTRSGEVWPAAANRRGAVTLVGARLVPTVGIQVSNFSPIASKFSARSGGPAAPQIFVSHSSKSLFVLDK